MTTVRIVFSLIAVFLAVDCGADAKAPVVVRSSAELLAVLNAEYAGRQIRLLRGTYTAGTPLIIPDGVVLVGEGVMRFDDTGIPTGFEPGTETIIEVVSGFTGAMLTLGNGSSIHGLVLQDRADPARIGNVIDATSRMPDDVVTASISECEIFNPHVAGFSIEGPIGAGLLLLTHNWVRPDGPTGRSPDDGASIKVGMARTIIHTNGGAAVFMNNFASHGRTNLTLDHNRVEGSLYATGGTNRMRAVTGAEATVDSDHNLFTTASRTTAEPGWTLLGASSPPHFANEASAGLNFSTTRMHSVGDRVEGFTLGIHAVAARRVLAETGPVSDNLLDIDLQGLRITTTGNGAADLQLYAALEAGAADPKRSFDVGDRNRLLIRIDGATGSGVRANVYAQDAGSTRPANLDTDNRIEIAGNPEAFARSNTGFDPAPPAEYFVGKH